MDRQRTFNNFVTKPQTTPATTKDGQPKQQGKGKQFDKNGKRKPMKKPAMKPGAQDVISSSYKCPCGDAFTHHGATLCHQKGCESCEYRRKDHTTGLCEGTLKQFTDIAGFVNYQSIAYTKQRPLYVPPNEGQ
jgi:hypothetical protein